MAKLRNVDIDANDINEFLENHDDLALELFVLKKARDSGFNAIHGGFYTDPLTGKPRQYDVRASIGLHQRKIAFAIECKSLKSFYPLIISRMKRISAESYFQYIVSEGAKKNYSNQPINPARIVTLEPNYSIYRVGEYVGKSTIQIGRNEQGDFTFGDSEVYDKWTQAINSAKDIIFASFPNVTGTEVPIHTAIIPILVVPDKTLWVIDYADNGAVRVGPTQVDEAVYYIDKEYESPIGQPYKISHLHFYTKKGICALFNNIANKYDEEYWEKLFNY